jgi:hypothetical protein
MKTVLAGAVGMADIRNDVYFPIPINNVILVS